MKNLQKSNKTVVVVVPIYREKLSALEAISLRQLNRVLGHYPRAFVAPQSLSFDYGADMRGFSVCRMPDEFFADMAADDGQK